MSYLVLARKWRPKFFSEVSGQDHVVKPLQNSLNKDKVHHAFLFTGTRGVGKTTIARLLAKALNCENGVTSEPCGKCQPCTSIDDGNFIDLIEVDAASQRGIDDTRELLENSQYTPSTGRYKVYLIDEVHQLTKEAFNALLKTLEEPPPHMKFLLATTESEKIPITVLSRCLKFNLKKISEDTIQQRMIDICKKEKIKYEDNALGLISQASDGSMRDG
ncbi:MAG: DNA polymerase III subunit gamma/tau, partial [Gammaproteobacteria bacterium]|nr:DNA polymerase III subunit gamma/tau [Gammaproteobacteria bacterium]